jgi:hypothetical protein
MTSQFYETLLIALFAGGAGIVLKRYLSKKKIKDILPDNVDEVELVYSKARLLGFSIHLPAVTQALMFLAFIVFVLPITIVPSKLPQYYAVVFLVVMAALMSISFLGIIVSSFVKCDRCRKRMLIQGFLTPKYLHKSTKMNFIKRSYRFWKDKKHICIYCGQGYRV